MIMIKVIVIIIVLIVLIVINIPLYVESNPTCYADGITLLAESIGSKT